MGVLLDNYDLWARHDAERERALSKFPRCEYCGETITEDYFYVIERRTVCVSCLNSEHRRYLDDFM